jgi:hypothetical protein
VAESLLLLSQCNTFLPSSTFLAVQHEERVYIDTGTCNTDEVVSCKTQLAATVLVVATRTQLPSSLEGRKGATRQIDCSVCKRPRADMCSLLVVPAVLVDRENNIGPIVCCFEVPVHIPEARHVPGNRVERAGGEMQIVADAGALLVSGMV